MLKWGKTLQARSGPPRRQEGARTALLVLTVINMLKFADRYISSSVKELIKAEMNLSDTVRVDDYVEIVFLSLASDSAVYEHFLSIKTSFLW